MTVKINNTAIANAKKSIKDKTVDTGSWDGTSLSLDDLKNWAVLIDDSKDPETKTAYSYPIGSGSTLNAKGLSTALGYSNHTDTGNSTASTALTELNDSYKQSKTSTKTPAKMGVFASKDDAKRLVFGPVMIPDCADCDFERGEKIFSADEIEAFCHKFNTFRINDDMHTYGVTGEQTGDVVENYTLKQELTETNILGEEITYPVGTWMIGSKVTNDKTWQDIQDGILKGYSGTYTSEEEANKLLESLASANKSETDILADLYASKRTLIKDLKNPVPVTVSFVDRPCVANAIFTSIKNNPDESFVAKAGRSISNATLDKLKKAHETAQSSLNTLKDLLTKADGERVDVNKMSIKEVDDMNEDEVKQLVKKSVEDETNELKETIESQKTEIESLKADDPEDVAENTVKCPNCGTMNEPSDKFCSNCGTALPKTSANKSDEPKPEPVPPAIE